MAAGWADFQPTTRPITHSVNQSPILAFAQGDVGLLGGRAPVFVRPHRSAAGFRTGSQRTWGERRVPASRVTGSADDGQTMVASHA